MNERSIARKDKLKVLTKMGGFTLLLLVFMLAGCEVLQDWINHPPSESSLVAWWRFDESSGITVLDSSGNRNDGKIYGASRVEGKSGKALRFDGVDDYVEVPSSDTLNLSDALTIEAWVFIEGLTGSEVDIIVNKEGSPGFYEIPYEIGILE